VNCMGAVHDPFLSLTSIMPLDGAVVELAPLRETRFIAFSQATRDTVTRSPALRESGLVGNVGEQTAIRPSNRGCAHRFPRLLLSRRVAETQR